MPPSDRRSRGFSARKPRPVGSGRTRPFPLKRATITAIVLGPLAAFSSAYSLAVVLDTSEPQIAQRLYPDLPRSKVKLGDLAIARALGPDGTTHQRKARRATEQAGDGATRDAPGDSEELAARLSPRTRATIEARALSALGDSALSAGALRQLAFGEGDPDRRRALLGLARSVSRRDIGASAQLAELHLRSGDFAAGMALIDEALSISDSLDERIFPLLLEANGNAQFASIVKPVLASDPDWSERLARHALRDPQSAARFVALARTLPSGSPALRLDYGAPLVEILAQDLRLSAAFEAHAIYAGQKPDAGAFGTRPLAPVEWQLIDGLEFGARMIGNARAPVAELFANPRRKGMAAQIVIRLAPGSYTLDFAVADRRGAGGSLHLARVCMVDGAERETRSARASLDKDRLSLPFTVGEGCPFQSLRLEVEAGGEAVSVLVDNVALNRSRRVRG